MYSFNDSEDLLMIDEHSEDSSISRTTPMASRNTTRRVSSNDTTPINASVGVATHHSTGSESREGITGRLHLIPNIVDASDTESIIDNNHHNPPPRVDTANLIPAFDDDVLLNNLNRSTDTKLTDANKYLIPALDDTFEAIKPTSSGSGRQSLGAPMSRSESISSLTSEASTSEVGARASKHRSSRKKRSSQKPRIKSKFADATIQYIRERIVGLLFSGWLEERQRLDTVLGGDVSEALGGWRDVVEVDGCEVEMIRQLDAVMASVPGAREGTKWLNMSVPCLWRGYLLWVMLPSPRTPGHYWWRVAAVNAHPTMGLAITLQVVRSVSGNDAESATSRARRHAAFAATAEGDLPRGLGLAWQAAYESIVSAITVSGVAGQVATLLRPENVAYAIKFIVLASISLVVGVGAACREMARLLLRLISETGTLIDRATPLLQTLIRFVEKIVGGFLLLLAMVYKDVRRPAPPPQQSGLQPAPQCAIMGPSRGAPSYPAGGERDPRHGANRRYVAPGAWQDSS